jgi:AAA+ ATPase superfamily predicted ATPase
MCVENPFKYGIEVTGDDFVDREKELAELREELLSGKSVVLYSQRRLGKSSLLKELFRRMRGDAILVYVKLYGTESREAFARKIAEGVITNAYRKVDRMREALGFLRELRPNLVLMSDGEVRLELGRRVVARGLEEVLDFPEQIAEKRGMRLIVAFDEFQEIGLFDGSELEKLMKAKFEEHKHTAYVFAGSKRHLLHEIFTDESRPLFKFARPMELGNITKEEFSKFISIKFRSTNGSIAKEAIDRVLEFTDGHPYFTQQLCHELWYLAKKIDDTSVVDRAIIAVLTHFGAEYEHIWDGLRSGTQRRLLLGMAREHEPNFFSTEFIVEYKLKTVAHVQKALKLLENKGLVEKGKIADIFFAEWLRRRVEL